VVSTVCVVLAGVGLVLAACGSSTTSPGTEGRQESWGSEAVEFFEAHAASICSQDVYGVITFYDTEVVADYRALMALRI
jgi:hypothetical protein